VRIALQHAAIHESAGIALVGVANDVFHVAFGLAREFPFAPGGESRPAAAAQAGGPHRLDHRVGIVLLQDAGQSLIAVPRNVIFDPLRVDRAAIVQDDLDLPSEEIHVGGAGHGASVGPLVGEPLDDAAPPEMLGHQFLRVLRRDLLIKCVVDHYDRPAGTRAETADADQRDVASHGTVVKLLFDRVANLQGPGGDATGPEADADDLAAFGFAAGFFGPLGVAQGRQFLRVGNRLSHAGRSPLPFPLCAAASASRY